MKPPQNICLKVLAGGALVLAATASVYAQDQAAVTDTNVCPVDTFFNGKIPDAIAKGKFSLNLRFRYENADQDGGTPYAHAETLRTRFGYTTAPLYGFQAMVEAENVFAGQKSTYAPGPGSPIKHDIIADPTATTLTQAWLGYNNTNINLSLKAGRQVIVLDNARFIGDVAWRQNIQTYDAAGLKFSPVKGLAFNYDFIWKVHRVFADDKSLAATTSDFDSASHLLNATYTLSPLAQIGGYTYLLDLTNERGGNAANSCATYGGFITGTWDFDKQHQGTLSYRAEYAVQTDYGDSTLSYENRYYLGDLKATFDRFNLGVGYEVLGGDSGVGFKTPLATLHAFNGWADVFLTTPATGLQDFYASAGVNLPGKIPVNFIYHKFCADTVKSNLGQEYDVAVSRKFGKNWTLLAKYAVYDGVDAPFAFNKKVLWAQIEFNF